MNHERLQTVVLAKTASERLIDYLAVEHNNTLPTLQRERDFHPYAL
jgi:hypothetical protein